MIDRKSKERPMTKALAKKVSTLPQWKGERPLNEKRVAWLNAKMEDGMFHVPRWTVAKIEGDMYRVNGQHSSEMIARRYDAKKAITVNLCFWDEFECDTWLELAEEFAQWDNPMSSRTPADAFRAVNATQKAIADLNGSASKLAIDALIWHTSGGKCGTYNRDERPSMVPSHVDWIVWSSEFTKTRWLRRVSTFASIYACYRVDQDLAKLFWQDVGKGIGDHPDDPARKLNEFLKTNSPPPKGEKKKAAEYYVKSLQCWNAFRAGKQVRHLRFEPGAKALTVAK